MKTSDFLFDLPESQIAQTPIEPRDHSRMMCINRATGAISHEHFYNVIDHLQPNDALVINETRVIPARLYGERESGGACEVLLLRQIGPKRWETLVKPGRRLHQGDTVSFGDGLLRAEIMDTADAGGRVVRFIYEGVFESLLDKLGEMPLPPYIHEKLDDPTRYQTVYARLDGSAAAPTAGLHFTPELLQKVRDMGVDVVPIVLHVGLGTFRPVNESRIEDHKMHREFYTVSQEAADAINKAKREGRRIIAVGTTSVRTLESAGASGEMKAGGNWTSIFIYPGYQFRFVDALVTNFHLPQSTLIMLVSALSTRENILHAYKVAVQEKYRFFSFGDAMFIH